jgi:Multiubiquitin
MPTQHLPIKIHIDKQLREAQKTPMTGAELKILGEVKAGLDLFQKIPGKDDKLIKDADSVDLKDGDQFYSAPSSLNPGSYAA